MFAEFSEGADYEEFLRLRGGVEFFVFENPGVAVGDEDGV
jgi:hypothetical protein